TVTSNISGRLINKNTQVVLGDKINHEIMRQHSNIGVLMDLIEQRSFHLPTGNILIMQYTKFGMTTFLRQVKHTFVGLIKVGSVVNNFSNSLRTFFYYDFHSLGIAERVARY